jgi:hypothetical protein
MIKISGGITCNVRRTLRSESETLNCHSKGSGFDTWPGMCIFLCS